MSRTVRAVLDALVVVLVGILETAAAWILYVGIYLGLESLFYPTNPQAFPADTLRMAVSILFYLIYIFLIYPRKKLPALWKAALSIGPIGAFQITIFFRLYESPWLASLVVGLIGLAWIRYLTWKKQSWLLSFAAVASTIVAILYAWPHP